MQSVDNRLHGYTKPWLITTPIILVALFLYMLFMIGLTIYYKELDSDADTDLTLMGLIAYCAILIGMTKYQNY